MCATPITILLICVLSTDGEEAQELFDPESGCHARYATPRDRYISSELLISTYARHGGDVVGTAFSLGTDPWTVRDCVRRLGLPELATDRDRVAILSFGDGKSLTEAAKEAGVKPIFLEARLRDAIAPLRVLLRDAGCRSVIASDFVQREQQMNRPRFSQKNGEDDQDDAAAVGTASTPPV